MEDYSPYERPTSAVAEQEPARRFRDPQGMTRFLQLMLVVYACLYAVLGLLDLTDVSVASGSYVLWEWRNWMLNPLYFHLFRTAKFLTIPTLCAWLWLVDANQRALRRRSAHHFILLVLTGVCVTSLDTVQTLLQPVPELRAIAAIALAGTGYLAWFMYHALRSTSPDRQAPLSFRLWCAALLAEALVPLWLRWIYTRTSDPDDIYLSKSASGLLTATAILMLTAVVGQLARQQRLRTRRARVGSIGN
ncbi:MAG TPA: hypothetical protein VIM98_13140 [Dyella sp.]|uniref:hypothetical protein n=1 Tax=Dyella sp. TaxID=1869338 RepID=UPI002F944B21